MIILARHAQTMGGKGVCIGRTDIPLSDIGREQARRMAEALAPFNIVRLCSSPSPRAIDSVRPLADKLDLLTEVHPHLDEIDMGEWDGKTFDEIKEADPDGYCKRGGNFGTFRPPGGENFNDVADRAMISLRSLATGPQPVLAMTHAGIIRSIMCRIHHRCMDDLFSLKPLHAHLFLFKVTHGGLESVASNIPPTEIGAHM